MPFPVNRRDERTYAPSWAGEVFVCDIDRTYLNTRFSSLKGIASIPFEFAIDKRDIEGMACLLREVRRGPTVVSRQTPLYFISASPPQLRAVIERKMLLDGLEFDGTLFKDWWQIMRGLRLLRLKEQLGFKLTALLTHRRKLPRSITMTLLGDDLESDPLAFALFADVRAGRLGTDQLLKILLRLNVADDDARDICAENETMPAEELVIGAYIRLEQFREASALNGFGGRLIGCRGAFQMAFALYVQGSISLDGALRVARELFARGATAAELATELADSARTCPCTATDLDGFVDGLRKAGLVLLDDVRLARLRPGRLRALHPVSEYWTPAEVR